MSVLSKLLAKFKKPSHKCCDETFKKSIEEVEKLEKVSGVKWSDEEIALFEQGLTDIEISKKTGRTIRAVQTKRQRLK